MASRVTLLKGTLVLPSHEVQGSVSPVDYLGASSMQTEISSLEAVENKMGKDHDIRIHETNTEAAH